jgi:DNA polymerase elongation subunit (family B)
MIRAFDSETYKGRAILLTKPDRFIEPRSWRDCVDFLAEDKENAAYNMDYDIQACLTFLPFGIRDRLALLNDATFYDGDEEYRVRYIRHKFCRVWREGRLLFTCYDMAQFYNCSLDRAAKKLGLKGKTDFPEEWYKNMLKRLQDPKTRDRVLGYALDDARLLQQIIGKTVEAFANAGMKFERPFSNASFSQRVFEKALTRRGVPKDVDRLAWRAYFGGRIECLQVGYFRRAYYYDIHSAYPSIIANLLATNGKWIRTEKYVRDDAVYAFCDCTLLVPENVKAGPVAVRLRSNRIVYPSGTFRRILTLAEYRYCEAHNFISKVHRVIQHIWPKRKFPFEEAKNLYKQRQLNPEQSYAIKIVLNAVYGKTAQMLKQRLPTKIARSDTQWIDGQSFKGKKTAKRFTNFVFASEITSRIRMKLLADIPQDAVISYATDGVFTTRPIEGLDVGEGLGQWSAAEVVTNLVVIGSGIYQYVDSEGKKVIKFRGFSPRNMDLKVLLKRAGNKRSIPVKVTRNTSLRQAVARPRDLNILKTVSRRMDLNFDSKRAWGKERNGNDLLTKRFTSEPLIYYGVLNVPRKET